MFNDFAVVAGHGGGSGNPLDVVVSDQKVPTNPLTMKPRETRFLPAVAFAFLLVPSAHAQNLVDWKAGGGNNLWSNTANWNGGVVPNSNTVDPRFNINNNVQINVDGSFTVRSYRTGNGANVSNPANEHLVYGDTLTIDPNSVAAANGVLNASANGIKLRMTCDVIVNNTASSTVETYVLNQNGANNIVEFGSNCALTLTTRLRTNTNLGSILFNCTFSPSTADLFIGSNNVSFGAGHSSVNFGRDIVFFSNSKLAVNGGTVLTANRKFQVNGTGAELELNAADTINGAYIVVGGVNSLLLDVNANQGNMGDVRIPVDGTLTIDVDPAVTNLFFADTSSQIWGAGASVTINGFKENTIRFGGDAGGLSAAQLAAIDGGAYTLTPTGFLTEGTPTNDYGFWAASQTPPVTGGPDGDFDKDGVSNLVEYALADGGERGVLSGTLLSFTKRGAPYGADLTYIIETSETLTGAWTPVVTHGAGQLGSPISYDLSPAPGTPRKFARLRVVEAP